MIRTIKFFKQDDKWYADILNHTLEENEMVMGADIIIDALSGGTFEIFIKVTDEKPKQPLLHFHIKEHDNNGAYYTVSGILYNKYAPMLVDLYPDWNHEIWLCNVAHDIFEDHPEDIYIIGYQI